MKNQSTSSSSKSIRNTFSKIAADHTLMGKIPPQATELEEAVLGALMLEKEALNDVIEILKPESFYKDEHRQIYESILSLFKKSEPVDLLTVVSELRKMGALEAAGGSSYIAQLTTRVNSSANVVFHARVVAEQAIKRELISVASQILKEGYEDITDVFQLLDRTQQALFEISESNIRKNYENMQSVMSQAFAELEVRKNHKDGLTGVPTGFMLLDRITSGWQKSDLIILAARPAMGKCLAKGTKVLLYNGCFKKVEDIVVGDLLMGDDSTPRKVLQLGQGQEMMYWVRQNRGIAYSVNESHILSLKRSRNEGKHRTGEVLNISVKEYIEKSPKFQSNYKGYKVAVEFATQHLPIAPYFLGLWLGDGHSYSSRITNTDQEIIDYMQNYANSLGLTLQTYTQTGKTNNYAITKGEQGQQHFFSLQAELRKLDLLENKHIPQNYLVNNTANRLELLAGLIDSDGSYLDYACGYEITQKNKQLAEQIKFLCDSLGFRTSLTAKKASLKSRNYETTVYRVRFYGDVNKIPVKVAHKKARTWNSQVSWQQTGITVEKNKIDTYYGFEIDGNGLFLLEDCTVTHNTAFVLSALRNAAVMFKKPVAIFSLEMSSIQLVNRLISAEAELESEKLKTGKLADYEWEQIVHRTAQLTEAPIFIDDTPAISILELRAKARRLKAQHDIQLIIIDYMQLMTGDTSKAGGNREQEIASISRALKQLAKELSIPVIALSQLSRAVETRGGDKKPQLSDLRESGCVTGDTLIFDATTGQLVPIQQLAERSLQTPIQCLSIDEKLKLGSQSMVKAFYSGKKEVFELKTRTGRTIKASANHPFLKLEGWTRLDQLAVGQKIALARELKVESDILWDEIASITPLGITDVYDATVDVTHNFVANDFIIHNSIEQDADMVLFLYRPEYYQITQDENGNSTLGVGEVIIAKHRNGALDTVQLKFIGKFTKFTNLDDGDNFSGTYGSSFNQSSVPSDFSDNTSNNGEIILGSKINNTNNGFDNGKTNFDYKNTNDDEVPF